MAGHTVWLILLFAVLAAIVRRSNSKSDQEYCSEDARLSSKFLVPFYESHLNVSRDEWIYVQARQKCPCN